MLRGVWILSGVHFGDFCGCHTPFPGVSAVFAFLEVSEGVSSGGRFLWSGVVTVLLGVCLHSSLLGC